MIVLHSYSMFYWVIFLSLSLFILFVSVDFHFQFIYPSFLPFIYKLLFFSAPCIYEQCAPVFVCPREDVTVSVSAGGGVAAVPEWPADDRPSGQRLQDGGAARTGEVGAGEPRAEGESQGSGDGEDQGCVWVWGCGSVSLWVGLGVGEWVCGWVCLESGKGETSHCTFTHNFYTQSHTLPISVYIIIFYKSLLPPTIKKIISMAMLIL